MARQVPDFIHVGAVVEWDTASGVAVAKVVSVGDFRIMLRAPDGYTRAIEATCFSSLADNVKHLRVSEREFHDNNVNYVDSMWD